MNDKTHLKILESLYSLVKENPNDEKVLKHVSVIAWQLEMHLGYEDYTYHYVAELAMSKEAKLEDNKFYISSIEDKIKDLKKSRLLSQDDMEKIKLGDKVGVDYFYIPRIYLKQEDEHYDEYLIPLLFVDPNGNELTHAYASKVPSNVTLWQAVGNDLEKDFSYPKKVTWWIENIEPLDTAKDKKGNELSRLIVDVYLENKIDTKKLRPAGYKVKWQE